MQAVHQIMSSISEIGPYLRPQEREAARVGQLQEEWKHGVWQ